MPELRTRPVRPADLGDDTELGELDRATWSTLHSVQSRPQPPYEPFFSDRSRPEHLLVAEAEDAAGEVRIAGYIRVVPPTALACHTHVRQIQGLAVADWARGRGVARRLLRAALASARGDGASRMTLRVLGHNAPARALYESEGFVVEGVLPGEFLLAGRYVDDVLMGRSLTP
ncbi:MULTISPECIES: GNAT family N-acetyltransferase [Streptomyces]|jgi:ribosomal protein S18 acetylase RimI-like enzyme|uniref:GNAT family N-acetyltransferase n=1 Tax=unclassified Streptomyces TaxID=2593676 RepID=UPI00088263A5|nr:MULTISPECIES: GNAT family N-acetyltransferase [unclassified Streptomyces]MDX2727673.1 GNAT family N-acetyltransferase [Streptomyces sp. PA03-2a]MDX3764155.1 GNAT family N-acetyltransferase [Streptomyces sp. AK08-01B]MDX3814162.1 GNAT family N-acetyltransferase [Streptomyces sp. AK08-01A]SCY20781.1 Ribosomal protein S18 acetylase RimI [Streptomyces sp. 136MFCol5.1]SFS73904.1 Ribosomal protein S18 acetylase RimI [Streptomyces sp. ok210]